MRITYCKDRAGKATRPETKPPNVPPPDSPCPPRRFLATMTASPTHRPGTFPGSLSASRQTKGDTDARIHSSIGRLDAAYPPASPELRFASHGLCQTRGDD